MFIDSVTIWVASGKGGDGLVHGHRENLNQEADRTAAMAVGVGTLF